MSIHFKKVTIIGVGLIGGSLARRMKLENMVDEVVGVGRNIENLKLAIDLGVIDRFELDPCMAVKEADLVVMATPVGAIIPLVQKIIPCLKKGAIITDVGSVKEAIVKGVESIIPEGFYFVGGHPIAGTEDSGVRASFPELFEGAKCILTPNARTNANAQKIVEALWKAVGSEVISMDAKMHDYVLAAVSHLPHIVAYALVNAVQKINEQENQVLSFSAGGFKDYTRVAASHPVMWKDICLMNRENLIKTMDVFQETLNKLKKYIEDEDGEKLYIEFEKAKQLRKGFK